MPARVLLDSDPYLHLDRDSPTIWARGRWPVKWVHDPAGSEPPLVTAFRLRFAIDRAEIVRVHVTADERYDLFLDGRRFGRGPERGDPANWFFETYDLPIDPGPHVLVARVWALGPHLAPGAQMSVKPGFLLGAEGSWLDRLSTGRAPWEANRLAGYRFAMPPQARYAGAKSLLDGRAMAWGVERGEGDGWAPAVPGLQGVSPRHTTDVPKTPVLVPATLPPMRDEPAHPGIVRHVDEPPPGDPAAAAVCAANRLSGEARAWQAMIDGRVPLSVPAQTRRRAIIDLGTYTAAYPQMVTSGGRDGTVRVHFAEALFAGPPGAEDDAARRKDSRDEIEAKHFLGLGPAFTLDGGAGRFYEPLWWEAGRYVELLVEAAAEPLTIDRFSLRHTGYPFQVACKAACADPRLDALAQMAVHTMRVGTHETYTDCPYYEQLMYVGDTRLECLVTYVMTADDRLPRKALRLFDASRLPSGLTQSRYPCHTRQVIPPFSLWWIGMVHDYALWRDDVALVRRMVPGVRAVLDGFERFANADGLVEAPLGWDFVDWVPGWSAGMPTAADDGVSSILNWHFVLALRLAAGLERHFGRDDMAARYDRRAHQLASALERFFDAQRGLYADDFAHTSFSEHAQALALLGGTLPHERRERLADALLADPDLARTTIYFSHYLFEALVAMDRGHRLFDRLGLWMDLPKAGLKTTPEAPEPTRSDCHPWGTHPLYHFFASVLGIRPASMGFATVRVAPQPGPLAWVRGTIPHPKGQVHADLRFDAAAGEVVLPEGVAGTFRFAGREQPLGPGPNAVAV